MKEIIDSIRVNLFERITSPLFGAFALSWCGWNYRFFLVALGDMNTYQKITYTQAVLYPDWHATLGHCVLYPLLSAGVFITVYPFPARWSFAYWHRMQITQKELRDKLEKATLLTAEESHALRYALVEQKRSFEKHIHEQDAQIESLRTLLNNEKTAHSSTRADMSRELGRLGEIESREKLLSDTLAHSAEKLKYTETELEALKKYSDNARLERERMLTDLKSHKDYDLPFPDDVSAVLSIIMANGGALGKWELSNALGKNLKLSGLAKNTAISAAIDRGWISDTSEGYVLTPKAKRLIMPAAQKWNDNS